MDTGLYVGTELELFAQAYNWKRYWSAVIGPYLGDLVLDVGAGIGGTAKTLASDGQKKWVCLEPDWKMVEQIKQRIAVSDLPAQCEARTGTIDDMAERDFTSVIYIDVLEHIEDDRVELRKAAERVRPGGYVIVLAPAHQWLYSPFDKAIGHFRRYTLRQLGALTPPQLVVERAFYLDSVGLFASLANRLVMKATMPTPAQIGVWDSVMVRISRIVDPLLLRRFGKTAVTIWRKP